MVWWGRMRPSLAVVPIWQALVMPVETRFEVAVYGINRIQLRTVLHRLSRHGHVDIPFFSVDAMCPVWSNQHLLAE